MILTLRLKPPETLERSMKQPNNIQSDHRHFHPPPLPVRGVN
jgi:hypothetical protein